MGVLLTPSPTRLMGAGALIALVAYSPEVVKVWIVVVIIGASFSSAACGDCFVGGLTIQASDLGKLKTVIQIICVVSAHPGPWLEQWQFGMIIVPVKLIAIAAIISRCWSPPSPIDYLLSFWKQIDHASNDRRKSSILPGARKKAHRNRLRLKPRLFKQVNDCLEGVMSAA